MGILLYLIGVVLAFAVVRWIVQGWVASERRNAGLATAVRDPGRHGREAERLRGELARLEAEGQGRLTGAAPRPLKNRPEILGPTFSESDFLAFAADVFTAAHAARMGRAWEAVGVVLGEAAREFLAAGPALIGAPRIRAVEAALTETHVDELWRVGTVAFDALADEPRAGGPLPVRIRETWRFRLRADAPLPGSPLRGPEAGWEVLSIPDGRRTALSAPRSPLCPPSVSPGPMLDLAPRCAALGLDPAALVETARELVPGVLAGDASLASGPLAAALARTALEDAILGVSRHTEEMAIQDATLIRVRSDADSVIVGLWVGYQVRAWLAGPAGEIIAGDRDRPTPQSALFSLRRSGDRWTVWSIESGS